jgi:hypothetical protein
VIGGPEVGHGILSSCFLKFHGAVGWQRPKIDNDNDNDNDNENDHDSICSTRPGIPEIVQAKCAIRWMYWWLGLDL